MWLSKLKDEDITPEIVQKLVFDGVEDRTGEKGDCILVLGGSSPFVDRVPKAVELYKAGLAPKIVMSGGPVWDTPYGRLSEADAMAACAMELGVPEEDIIRDNLARTTIENMICGALAIGRELKFPNVKKVLLVTHGGICRVIRSYFVDMTNEEYARYVTENAAIMEYTF